MRGLRQVSKHEVLPFGFSKMEDVPIQFRMRIPLFVRRTIINHWYQIEERGGLYIGVLLQVIKLPGTFGVILKFRKEVW